MQIAYLAAILALQALLLPLRLSALVKVIEFFCINFESESSVSGSKFVSLLYEIA